MKKIKMRLYRELRINGVQQPDSLSADLTRSQLKIRNTIICHLSGGLANQMICYKLGRYLADTKGFALMLDASAYENLESTSNRNLQLLNYHIQYNAVLFSGSILKNILTNNAFTSLSGKGLSDFHNPEIKSKALAAVNNSESIIYCDLWGGLVLREIADKHASENGVLDHLKINRNEHFTERDFACLKSITRARNSVAIHVRRGDFSRHDGGLLVTHNFYNNSIKEMEDKLEDAVFYVFSDDIPWCKENLKARSMMHFVDFNGEQNAFKDMSLAASCKHFILSNESTFSHQIWELSDKSQDGIVIRSDLSKLDRNSIVDGA
ncbi:alpha-1,2-fucosyltransferase [Pseudomonadota bacterium]